MTTADTRTSYIDNLRALATLLDNDSAIPLPHSINTYGREVTWHIHRNLDEALALRALMVNAAITRETGDFPIRLGGTLAGFAAVVYVRDRIALDVDAQPVEPALAPALAALVNPTKLTAVSS